MFSQGTQTWAQGGTQNITFPRVGNGGQENQFMQRLAVQKRTECSRSIEWFCVAGVMGKPGSLWGSASPGSEIPISCLGSRSHLAGSRDPPGQLRGSGQRG